MREITVKLSATISDYLQNIGRARQETDSLASSVDSAAESIRGLEDASQRVSGAASGFEDVSGSADDATASLQDTAGAADSAAGSIEDVSGSAQSAAGGLEDASGAAQDTAGGLSEAGAAAENVAASVGQVGAESQSVAGAMLDASGAAQSAAGGFTEAGAAADGVAASVGQVGAESQNVAGAMLDASGAAQTAAGGLDGLGSSSLNAAAAVGQISGESQTLVGNMLAASGAAQDAAGSYQGLGGTIRGLGGSFNDFADRVRAGEGELRNTTVTVGLVGGGLAALMGTVIRTGVEYNTLQQVAGRALQTMTGDAALAADQMERLHSFADTSPFARDTWIQAQQQLMAFGMEAERVIPTLEGIQNAVAAIGGGDAEIMRIVDILGNVEGQGRITGQELQRLGQMGINAAELIAESMGTTADEIRSQITAGTLDAATAVTALTEGMNNRFSGAAEGLRDTMEGSLDRIRARIRDLGSVIAAPLVDPQGGGFLVGAINQAADFGSMLLELPEPIIQIAGLTATAAGGITAFGAAAVMAWPSIRNFASAAGTAWTALGRFVSGGGGVVGAIRRIGTAAGIGAAAWLAWEILQQVTDDTRELATSAAEMGQELTRAAQGGEAFANVTWDNIMEMDGAKIGAENIGSLSEALGRLDEGHWIDGPAQFLDAVGLASSQVVELEAHLESLDTAIQTALGDQQYDVAAAGFRELANAADELGWSADQILEYFPEATSAIQEMATRSGHAISNQELLAVATNEAALEALASGASWSVVERHLLDAGDAAGEAKSMMDEAAIGSGNLAEATGLIAEAASEVESALGGMIDGMRTLGLIERDLTIEKGELNQMMREMNETIAENGQVWDANTDAGLENLQGMADIERKIMEVGNTMIQQGASVDELSAYYRNMYDEIVQMVGGNEELARSIMGIPEEWDIEIWAEDEATMKIQEVEDKLEESTRDPYEYKIEVDAEELENLGFDTGLLGETDLQRLQILAELDLDPRNAEAELYDFMMGDYEAWVEFIGDREIAFQMMQDFIAGDWETVIETYINDADARSGMLGFINEGWDITSDIQLGNEETVRGQLEALGNEDWQVWVMVTDEGTVELTREQVQSIDDRTVGVWADDQGTIQEVQGGIDGMQDGSAWIQVDDHGTVSEVQVDILSVRDGQATIQVSDHNGVRNVQTSIDNIRNGSSTIHISSVGEGTVRAAINRLTGYQGTASIRMQVTGLGMARNALSRMGVRVPNIYRGGLLRRDSGGPIPGQGLGGRFVPDFGTGGIDRVLGINSKGTPVARVDEGEFITRSAMSKKYEDLLWAINADNTSSIMRIAASLPGRATGGFLDRPYSDMGRSFSPTPQAPVLDMSQISDALSSARPLIGEIRAESSGDSGKLVQAIGDAIFRRLREEGVPVGSYS